MKICFVFFLFCGAPKTLFKIGSFNNVDCRFVIVLKSRRVGALLTNTILLLAS